jgi:beta-lactamase regulating signal transducer with metallopeptidase domain
MLIAWMGYAVALGAIVAGAALALDRLAEIWSASRRAVWLAAMLVAALVPTGIALRPAHHATTLHRDVQQRQGIERELTLTPHAVTRTPSLVHRAAAAIDRFASTHAAAWNRDAVAAWIVCSLALLMVVARGVWRLERRRATWRSARLDGASVLISDDVGPAVVGALRPRIVLPAWTLSLEQPARELMLRHEAEHIRARDPLVLSAGLLALVLQPWNPMLWIIVRRLRLAVEIDCDRRVLRAGAARERDYGMLLLSIGARTSGVLQFSPSLAEPRLFLERRIIAMTATRPARPLLASLPFAAVAIVAATAAAQTPRPAVAPSESQAPVTAPVIAPPALVTAEPPAAGVASVAPTTPPRLALAPTPSTPVVVMPGVHGGLVARPMTAVATHTERSIPIEVLRAWVRDHYPSVLTGESAINYITFVVDANEQYMTSRADSFPNLSARTQVMSSPGPGIFARSDSTLRRVGGPDGPQPLFIVDGVRVNSLNDIDPTAIKRVEVLKGQAAVTEYGSDAGHGVVVVDTRGSPSVLEKLGVESTRIQNIEILRVAPGTIGPNELRVMVVRLKPAGD